MRFWERLVEIIFWHFQASDISDQTATPSTPSTLIASPIAGSCNTPTNRLCWSDGFDIHTDYEKYTPTGVVRNFYLELTNEHIAPDGYNVSRMLFNKTYPGPLLEGNWGDTFLITVKNNLVNHNGTSVHWHGVRQLNTNWFDGVSGVTECPIPPGESFTYVWNATQYGVSWYHSHFSLQYADGLVGPLKINGPTSMNDVDLGPVLVTDHFHKTAFSQVMLEYLGRPPSPDTMLLNGNGTYYCCGRSDVQCIGGSRLTTFNFEKGKTYKMSLVNTATSTHTTFWIDGHTFWVVGMDFVPIRPYPSSMLNIAIGQRYDIIVTANATVTASQTDFWIHGRDCANGNARSNLGIIRYDPKSKTIPWTPPPDQKHICYGCLDEFGVNLQPMVNRTIPLPANEDYNKDEESLNVHLVGYPDDTVNTSLLHKWVLKDSSMYLDWSQPSLSLINIAGQKHWTDAPFPKAYQPVWLDKYADGSWVYFLIEGKFNESLDNSARKIYKTQAPVAHPIHVHGHDFVILASGTQQYQADTVKLNLINPPRRDVALLPVNGFLVVAFRIDNPGAWLMHCHIAWHASGGLALQFIEKPDELGSSFRKSGILGKYSETCTNWAAYYTVFNKNAGNEQEDSGI